jgi:hypothetical protein
LDYSSSAKRDISNPPNCAPNPQSGPGRKAGCAELHSELHGVRVRRSKSAKHGVYGLAKNKLLTDRMRFRENVRLHPSKHELHEKISASKI